MIEADPNVALSNNNTAKPKKIKSKASKSQPKPAVKTEEIEEPAMPPPGSSERKNSAGPDLNINIQIHISSDASPDQIKSIFENMAKYVYNSGK